MNKLQIGQAFHIRSDRADTSRDYVMLLRAEPVLFLLAESKAGHAFEHRLLSRPLKKRRPAAERRLMAALSFHSQNRPKNCRYPLPFSPPQGRCRPRVTGAGAQHDDKVAVFNAAEF